MAMASKCAFWGTNCSLTQLNELRTWLSFDKFSDDPSLDLVPIIVFSGHCDWPVIGELEATGGVGRPSAGLWSLCSTGVLTCCCWSCPIPRALPLSSPDLGLPMQYYTGTPQRWQDREQALQSSRDM